MAMTGIRGRSGGVGSGSAARRRVMIIADPGRESGAALEWALSHAVVEGDEVHLLHVNLPPNSAAGPSRTGSGGSSGSPLSAFLSGAVGGGGGDGEFLQAMRSACKARQPLVPVEAERVEPATEGREAKAQTILAECHGRGVELLVIGQRRNSSFLRLRSGGASSSRGGQDSTVEFLMEHSKCLCVSVQKKGQNDGYLISTKTHKNFWLLA